jgi:hypothetical protein
MAAIIGSTGGITITSGYHIHASGWSFDLEVEVADSTSWSSVGYRERDGVLVGATGSITGFADAATTKTPIIAALLNTSSASQPSSATVAVTLTAASNRTWAFNAVLTGMSQTAGVTQSVEQTYNFASTGLITQDWTT